MDRGEVIQQLENYKDNKALIEIKKLEIEIFKPLSEKESIEILTFNKKQEEKVQTSSLSDSTKKAAFNYNSYRNMANNKEIKDILDEIKLIEFNLDKLETAVNWLPIKEKQVICELFFIRNSVNSVSQTLKISRRTVCRYKNSGISRLCVIYNRLENFR